MITNIYHDATTRCLCEKPTILVILSLTTWSIMSRCEVHHAIASDGKMLTFRYTSTTSSSSLSAITRPSPTPDRFRLCTPGCAQALRGYGYHCRRPSLPGWDCWNSAQFSGVWWGNDIIFSQHNGKHCSKGHLMGLLRNRRPFDWALHPCHVRLLQVRLEQ